MILRFFSFLLCFLSILPSQAHVMLALKQRNADVLVDAFHKVSNPHSPHYGKYWSQEMIDQVVNPPKVEVDRMIRFFGESGLHCSQMGASIKCDEMPCLNGFYGLVEFVEIPSGFVYSPRHHVGDGDGYVGRETMLQLYNITHSRVHSTNVSVCAVEYQIGEGFNQDDLVLQQKLNGETANPILSQHIIGPNEGPDIESQLDVQMMTQVAENVDLWYWHDTLWLYSFAVHFLNSTSVPDVLSMSWGWSEKEQCDPGLGTCPNITSSEYVHRVNLEYVKMGLRGISVVVASGDAGAPGRTNELCLNPGPYPVYPGSSPFVTSVGATYVEPTQSHHLNQWTSPLCKQYGCVNGTNELPTNYNATGWTSGGGFDVYYDHYPSWQKKEVLDYLKSNADMPTNFSRVGRGYPDVSVVGHNCPVVSQGYLSPVDGTSCSSPVFAAILSLLNDHQVSQGKPKLGFANPLLYQMGKDGVFKDITEGNNWCTEAQCCNKEFGFEAWDGWDPVTGLGTPNVGLMIEWLDRYT